MQDMYDVILNRLRLIFFFFFQPVFAGLALVYILQTVDMTQFAVRQLSEVENLMTSFERVMTYTKIDSEPGYKVERLPPEHWPHKGNIAFQDVSLTYYPGAPQVLKEINLNITGGTKIGVAGRTGAGKSSFVAALMRMPDADGDIMVDEVRLTDISLREARRRISVLGQNPVLLSGSVRQNLDLMQQYQDASVRRCATQRFGGETGRSVGPRVIGTRRKFQCRRTPVNLSGSCVAAAEQDRHLG